jgi:hypothetical protein
MSYAADHMAWQQRVAQENNATKRFIFWKTTSGFSNETDGFFSDWTKKNFMTTNQMNHTKMLQKMHPHLIEKFNNYYKLNQKFHPRLTGKFLTEDLIMASQTPNYNGRKSNFILLQGPVHPKPPAFFEQAYQGKEDYRKKVGKSQTRPFSAFRNDDQNSYMSHHRLKQQLENNKKTLDPSYRIRTRKIKKKEKKQNDEEEDWERFNEEISYKSGYSKRSSKSHNSRVSNRLRSAHGMARRELAGLKERQQTSHVQKRIELTENNLKNFEEKLSSQISVGEENKESVKEVQNTKEEQLENEEEGEEAEKQVNPNEAEVEQKLPKEEDKENFSVLAKSEFKSLSKASRTSYVESLRNELRREREKREELEKKIQELTDSKKG